MAELQDDTPITAELVRDLLRDQHPDLAELPLREVEGGWGNQMWRLGDELAVRVQRMDTTSDNQLRERRWLPLLAPRLPLPIPVPVRSGAPSERFPKMWTVMTWVPGRPLDHAAITRSGHAADTLAAFLRALHVAAPADAPTDSVRGRHPSDLTDGFDYFLGSVDVGTIGGDTAAVRAVWNDAVAAPAWSGPPVWVHGDLHPANVVVADGTLAGVVDFGDLFAGDPAVDLASAWVLLPPGAAARFFAAYATGDEATIRRARGLAALKSLFLMLMGQNGDRGLPGGQPAWGPAGRAALDRLLNGHHDPSIRPVTEQDVRRAYTERAHAYTEVLGSVTAMADEDQELITRWARGIDGRALDAGCGPGHWTQHLHELGVDVRGVDLVPRFVSSARERFPDVPFDLGSLRALPVDDASLGGVLVWYSLIHTEPDDVPGVLEELARTLRPGGTLLLGFFDGATTERLDHRVVTAYSWPVAELTRLLEGAGFEVLESHARTDPGSRPHAALLARRAPRPRTGDAGEPKDEEDET